MSSCSCQLRNVDEFAEFDDPEDTFSSDFSDSYPPPSSDRVEASPNDRFGDADVSSEDDDAFPSGEDDFDEFGSDSSSQNRQPQHQSTSDDHADEDEEFEAIPPAQRKPSSQPKADSASKPQQKQQPAAKSVAHLRRHWTAYHLEMVIAVIIGAYMVNYSMGSQKNTQLAQAWMQASSDLVKEQFALVGDDGVSEPNSGKLTKESEHSYSLWLSGRVGIEAVLVELRLLRRQCLLSSLSTTLLRTGQDKMTIQVSMEDNEMDGFVMAIGRRRRLQQLTRDHLDLAFFCPGGGDKKSGGGGQRAAGLPECFNIVTEFPEVSAAFLNPYVCNFFKENEQSIEYVFFSDQYTGPKPTSQDDSASVKLPNPQKSLLFTFTIGSRTSNPLEEMEDSAKFMHFVCFCIDKVRRIHLSKEVKFKSERSRQRSHDNRIKSLQAARQEAAQSRRDEKVRAANERIMSEDDPDKARKLENKIQRKDKRKQPMVKMMSSRS